MAGSLLNGQEIEMTTFSATDESSAIAAVLSQDYSEDQNENSFPGSDIILHEAAIVFFAVVVAGIFAGVLKWLLNTELRRCEVNSGADTGGIRNETSGAPTASEAKEKSEVSLSKEALEGVGRLVGMFKQALLSKSDAAKLSEAGVIAAVEKYEKGCLASAIIEARAKAASRTNAASSTNAASGTNAASSTTDISNDMSMLEKGVMAVVWSSALLFALVTTVINLLAQHFDLADDNPLAFDLSDPMEQLWFGLALGATCGGLVYPVIIEPAVERFFNFFEPEQNKQPADAAVHEAAVPQAASPAVS